MIRALQAEDAPLAADYAKAAARAEATSRMARKGGDYPLLSGGDVNLNSLFVEQAARLINPSGMVGLLIPSGLATEKSSQAFFSDIVARKSAKSCYDFFNKRNSGALFFEDVYYRFKFSALTFSGAARQFDECRFATFIRDVAELDDPERTYAMGIEHFRLVNPNTGTAPVYRAARDREISSALYRRFAPLVRHDGRERVREFPVRYMTLFHMANGSSQFRTREELEASEGAWREAGGVWRSQQGPWAPLYEGKMVQAYDLRASGIAIVEDNLHRPGQADTASDAQRADPDFAPTPRYYVPKAPEFDFQVAIKDITSTTNTRSLIVCIIPPVGAGHTLPIPRVEESDSVKAASLKALLLATLNSVVVDFIARTKILSNHASWFILEQLPVIPPDRFEAVRFGSLTAGGSSAPPCWS